VKKKDKKMDAQLRWVKRVSHVRYDTSQKKYVGLPPEWESALAAQFGLPPNLTESEEVPGYNAPIPTVLLKMRQFLVDHGGLDVKGIFRLAPDAEECAFVKKQLNSKEFESCEDVNCISNLIKVWFRDLPRKLFAFLKSGDVDNCKLPTDTDEVARNNIPEPYLSIFAWLLDLCVLVTKRSNVNAMTAQNMAIVIAPNLIASPELGVGSSPSAALAAMNEAKQVTKFFELAIIRRSETNPDGPTVLVVEKKKKKKKKHADATPSPHN